MTVTLYKTPDANNKLDKACTLVSSLSCQIHEESNIIDPTIVISGSYFDPEINYMYIDDFGRYYYITDITVEHQRIILKGHVDVLKTYSSDIKLLKVIADRSSSFYNLYQKDSELPMESRGRITMSPFSGSFSGEGICLITTGSGV